MKEVVCGFLLAVLVSSLGIPATAQTLKGRDLVLPRERIKPQPKINDKTRFDSVEAYTDGAGVWVRWRMESELENYGFFVYRIDGKGKKRVSDSVTLASNRFYGQPFFGTEYRIYDRGGSERSIYQVETVPMTSSSISSNAVRATYVSDLSTVGLGGNDFRLPRISAAGKVEQKGLALDADLQNEVAQYTKAADINTQRWVANRPGVKIGVNKNGIYRVSKAQLQTAGFDVNSDPALWQLYRDGVQQAINVGPNADYIEFYGKGIDLIESDTSIYYLVVGDVAGARMSTRVARPSLSTVVSRSYTQVFEKSERNSFFNDILNGDANNWFDGNFPIGPSPNFAPYALDLDLSPVDTTAATFKLEVTVQGYTFTLHPVSMTLNNQTIGSVQGIGRNPFTATFTLPTSMLLAGTNTLKIFSTAATNDVSLFDKVKVTYQRGYSAVNDQLTFNTQNYKISNVGGFTNGNVRLFDITEDGNPVLMTNLAAQASGPGFTLRVPAARSRLFQAVSDAGILQPVSIEANAPSQLSAQAHSSNLLVLSYKGFITQANAWADYRRGQGFTAEVIDVSDIFDEYSYGVQSADALKSFLQYAQGSSGTPPQYVLLLGDATYDPRNYMGLGFSYYVPTKLVTTVSSETGSDDSLTDFNNDGLAEIAIGRIPAESGQEVTDALSRVMNFEQPVYQDPNRGFLFAYDVDPNIDFAGMSTRVRDELPAGTPTTLISKNDANAETNVVTAINSGKFAVNYSGHGSTGVWSNTNFFSIFNVAGCDGSHPCITNATNRSVFTMLTCLNGFFLNPINHSLAEVLLKSSNGGAIAAWASTGLTTPNVQEVMGRRFYNQLGAGNIKRMGDLVLDAKTVVTGGNDVKLSWVLLGDPMLKVRQ